MRICRMGVVNESHGVISLCLRGPTEDDANRLMGVINDDIQSMEGTIGDRIGQNACGDGFFKIYTAQIPQAMYKDVNALRDKCGEWAQISADSVVEVMDL